MRWNCPQCATSNLDVAPKCSICGRERPFAFGVWAYVSAGPSLFLIAALLSSGGYARALYLSRAEARTLAEARRVEVTQTREALHRSQTEVASLRNEVARVTGELGSALNELAASNEERSQLSLQVSKLQGVVDNQATQLAVRPRAAAKTVYAENRCSSRVRAAMMFRETDGSWPTYSFWEFAPGVRERLQVRNRQGQTVEARVTWNLVYVYAETADRSWFYRGVSGEVQKVRDGERVLTMRGATLPTDRDDNYVLTFCESR